MCLIDSHKSLFLREMHDRQFKRGNKKVGGQTIDNIVAKIAAHRSSVLRDYSSTCKKTIFECNLHKDFRCTQ